MAEEADDPFDRLLHAIEFGEGRISPDRPVHENAAETRVSRRIDKFGLADRHQNTFCCACVGFGLVTAEFEIGLERHLARLPLPVKLDEVSEDVGVRHRLGPLLRTRRCAF